MVATDIAASVAPFVIPAAVVLATDSPARLVVDVVVFFFVAYYCSSCSSLSHTYCCYC